MTIKKSDIVKAVIVRTKFNMQRNSGEIIKFDENAAIIITNEGLPKGTFWI